MFGAAEGSLPTIAARSLVSWPVYADALKAALSGSVLAAAKRDFFWLSNSQTRLVALIAALGQVGVMAASLEFSLLRACRFSLLVSTFFFDVLLFMLCNW